MISEKDAVYRIKISCSVKKLLKFRIAPFFLGHPVYKYTMYTTRQNIHNYTIQMHKHMRILYTMFIYVIYIYIIISYNI